MQPSFTPGSPHAYVADGTYHPPGGGRWRWYIERVPGAAHPMQTVQGWCGPDLVTVRADVTGACEATARSAIDVQVIIQAEKAAADVKRKLARAG